MHLYIIQVVVKFTSKVWIIGIPLAEQGFTARLIHVELVGAQFQISASVQSLERYHPSQTAINMDNVFLTKMYVQSQTGDFHIVRSEIDNRRQKLPWL